MYCTKPITLCTIAAVCLLGLAAPSNAGQVFGWGQSVGGTPPAGDNFMSIASGYYHNLALADDGSISGWGSNSNGQLNVPGLNSGFIAISAGFQHSLAIRGDGTLVGFGQNADGQITIPAGTYSAIAAGRVHSVAIRTDGSLAAWGGPNSWGELTVPAGYDYVAVEANEGYGVALKSDGSIATWGMMGPAYGAPGGTGYLAIAGGGSHAIALGSDSKIYGWGTTWDGRTDYPPAANFIAIGASEGSTAAITDGGAILVARGSAWVGYGLENVPPGNNYVAVAGDRNHFVALDNVPEPASLSLLAIGGLALLPRRRGRA